MVEAGISAGRGVALEVTEANTRVREDNQVVEPTLKIRKIQYGHITVIRSGHIFKKSRQHFQGTKYQTQWSLSWRSNMGIYLNKVLLLNCNLQVHTAIKTLPAGINGIITHQLAISF